MERTMNPNSFDFKQLESQLEQLKSISSNNSNILKSIKNSLNKFFIKSKCKEVIYTKNTDKLFFGMRVYIVLSGDKALELMGDNEPTIPEGYYVELDSKLFDSILDLSGEELTAILLHEVGHVAYDTQTIEEVKNSVDAYFANSGRYYNMKTSAGFNELLAFGMKDAVMKAGSMFTKFGNTEIMADSFVVSCGYGPQLESAIKKILFNVDYMSKDIDNRFIALSWVLRVGQELAIFRVPAVKTLNKAAKLTGSTLEKRELQYAANVISTMDSPLVELYTEAAWDNIKNKFSDKIMKFKRNGIKQIKNDVFELKLRLRTCEDIDELMSIIRSCNSYISILQEYLEEDISDTEREDVVNVLQEIYSIRETAANNKEVSSRYSGYIQVTYPTIH